MTSNCILSSRGGRNLLVVGDFTYYKFRTSVHYVTWRCTFRGCTATAIVESNNVPPKERGIHKHVANVQKIERKRVSEACKRKAQDDLCERPSKIIRTVLAENLPVTFDNRDKERVRRNLYNARRKSRPFNIPRSISMVHCVLDEMSLRTCRDEPFLLVNDSNKNIIIFSCQKNVDVLRTMETIFVDGTFSYCTKFFKQLFTVHGVRNGHYLQLCYALLPDKTTKSYEDFLDKLTEICPFIPTNAVVDFETAVHNALVDKWPNLTIIGCRYHLRQAWYRQIQHLGLQTVYQKSKSSTGDVVISEGGRWLRYVFGLTFLAPEEVHDALTSDLVPIRPTSEKLEKFTQYLLTNYINDYASFPPSLWACQTASLERTTNACESFHSRFNDSFYNTHPDIFSFTERLIEFQTDTYVGIQSLHLPKHVRNTYAACKTHIENLILQYNDNEITRLHFIKRTGYYMCPD
jgi:hypothetical protein